SPAPSGCRSTRRRTGASSPVRCWPLRSARSPPRTPRCGSPRWTGCADVGASAGLWYAGGVDPVGRRRALTGVATPGQALRAHPLGLLLTAWPWRCLAYLVATPVVAATWLLTCGALLPLAGLPLARVERWRLRWVDHHPVADPHTPAPAPGLAAWLRHRLQERATWTELLYGV